MVHPFPTPRLETYHSITRRTGCFHRSPPDLGLAAVAVCSVVGASNRSPISLTELHWPTRLVYGLTGSGFYTA